ncbi:MAG: putative GNAT superfamily acetyltransferase [Minisyncoccia bacterium]|jgi:predicted GNAT superfamily acetyltransferase
MSTIDTANGETPAAGTEPSSPLSTIQIRELTVADEMVVLGDVFQQVWGSATEIIRLEMLMAISHAGGYVVGAFDMSRGHDDRGEILGASVGVLAVHHGQPALHSHVTGILAGARSTGLGRAMKLHQQQWALDRGIEWIVWTFDPLVQRNAWFNIAILGAEVHEYLPHFYGTMTDAINAGDDSDRLLMAWSTATNPDDAPRDGTTHLGQPGVTLIPTPDDIVTLRRTDLNEVARWRGSTRTALTEGLASGSQIVGFTRDGDYVVST